MVASLPLPDTEFGDDEALPGPVDEVLLVVVLLLELVANVFGFCEAVVRFSSSMASGTAHRCQSTFTLRFECSYRFCRGT